MKSKFTLLLLVLSGYVFGQQSFTLQQAIDQAIANNTQSKNARLDVEIAKKKIWETTAIGLPNINGELTYQNFLDIPTQVIPAQAFNPAAPPDEFAAVQFGVEQNVSAGVTATQLIFSGSYIVGLQTAKLYKLYSESNAVKSELEVKKMVSQSYFTILVIQQNKKLIEQNITDLEKLKNGTEKTLEQGLIESIALDQVKINLLSTKNILSEINRNIEISEMLLKVQLNIPLDQEIILSQSIDEFSNEEYLSSPAEKFDVSQSIDYQIVVKGEELSKMSLKNSKYVSLPSMSAFLSHSQNAFSNKFDFPNWYPSTIVGLKLNVPIFNSLGQNAVVQQNRLELEKVTNQKETLEKNLNVQFLSAKSQLETNKNQLEFARENLALSKNIYDQTLRKYNEGISTSFDLTQSHAQYIASQTNYFNALLKVLNSKTELDYLLNNK